MELHQDPKLLWIFDLSVVGFEMEIELYMMLIQVSSPTSIWASSYWGCICSRAYNRSRARGIPSWEPIPQFEILFLCQMHSYQEQLERQQSKWLHLARRWTSSRSKRSKVRYRSSSCSANLSTSPVLFQCWLIRLTEIIIESQLSWFT